MTRLIEQVSEMSTKFFQLGLVGEGVEYTSPSSSMLLSDFALDNWNLTNIEDVEIKISTTTFKLTTKSYSENDLQRIQNYANQVFNQDRLLRNNDIVLVQGYKIVGRE